FEGRTTAGVARSLPLEVGVLGAGLLGRWEPEADLTLVEQLGERECESLRFDPWHTGPDLLLAGFLNRLRLPAYAASQAVRRHESGAEQGLLAAVRRDVAHHVAVEAQLDLAPEPLVVPRVHEVRVQRDRRTGRERQVVALAGDRVGDHEGELGHVDR